MHKKFSKKFRLSSLLNKICLKIIEIPMRIISKCRKIMKCCVLIGLERPNRSKTIKNRKIHTGELSEFFSFFFVKFHFPHFFQLFSSARWRDFRDFARSPMQSTLKLWSAARLPRGTLKRLKIAERHFEAPQDCREALWIIGWTAWAIWRNGENTFKERYKKLGKSAKNKILQKKSGKTRKVLQDVFCDFWWF